MMTANMVNSKSASWLRPAASADPGKFYANQQQKHSTQNIHSIVDLHNTTMQTATSHLQRAQDFLMSQEKQKPKQRVAPQQLFKCCKEGEMLKSSEETANCSLCGQFFIFTVIYY